MRAKYPNGVAKGHTSYNPALDRDKDGYACEL
ncbi:excalibur calcium-binding domain-containing protein [Bacillus aquiflavi]|uniref:Excalibur calcium-binding domain-containing protein n=1 Tax=Bacillus aquiflavi TaxID=2672567 RepID=A0A6B3VYX8_9BACI|nr:excalibur calcium-binding domain-containing protein [Bacillus aquiflavi]MBA4537227.1 excalibur calcium-binding domain-containing protein [Bacillus aquiflavi]NEY81485.1 excalibur calcium-binding domain-containing protein [Bacillus aquiflavi]UAC49996.1 excalibur calcium-binding domain-containing protein [Bacillus aquiflavi]